MNRLYNILFSLVILPGFLLSSCSRSDNRKEIERLVTEWQGKEIIFPDDIIFTRYISDTVDYRIPDSEYKVLVYVDPLGCTSCKLIYI